MYDILIKQTTVREKGVMCRCHSGIQKMGG